LISGYYKFYKFVNPYVYLINTTGITPNIKIRIPKPNNDGICLSLKNPITKGRTSLRVVAPPIYMPILVARIVEGKDSDYNKLIAQKL
jgi:hypothetical protein